MLKLLKKLLNLWPFGGHGVPDMEVPAASQPRVPGLSVKGDRLPRVIQSNGKFPAAIIQAAIDHASINGAYIWPSVTLAQWALESAYGTRMPKGSNNPFGIKALKGQPTVDAVTWEVEGGKKVTKSQSFRKFASQSEAFEAHNKLLATSKHYNKARAMGSAVAFAKALTGVYATDPDYDKKLRNIMGANNLYQYDNP